jgi:leucyl aminopeptidase
MSSRIKISMNEFGPVQADVAVIFLSDDMKPTKEAGRLGEGLSKAIGVVSEIERFKGKARSAMMLTGMPGLNCGRVLVFGLGEAGERSKVNFVTLGGLIGGKLSSAQSVAIIADLPGEPLSDGAAADLALGMVLRDYNFDKYKTKKKDDDVADTGDIRVSIMVPNASGAKKAWKAQQAVADGVMLARDLVNEPPNVLTPDSFAQQAAKLEQLGVEIEILDEKQLKKIGMRALLGVGQGSAQESRVVIMRWNGAKKESTQPLAFIGKGVVFDTGGISIKPAAGMEDMKGDMGGAAAVVGLMHALAARKAAVNVIGAIGLVENMPDGNAQRPGDIVKSLSGQTIEIINTDAEGRLVLADVLWYVQETYKPQFMIDLATLTGAIMVALAQEYAGVFSNNDELVEHLRKAGELSGEKVWRLPLGSEYDKMIDSKFADMKNTGGRYGGSITAAQFLQRFVNNTPWVHIDIAGTAMGSPSSDINRSWGSGYGVRLLDRLIADHYEK